jgi:uncharacterized membrane protein
MVDRKRHLAKALTYRVFGSAATGAVAYMVSGSVGLGATLGLVDTFAKIGLYYIHERVWYRVKWGVHEVPWQSPAPAQAVANEAPPTSAAHASAGPAPESPPLPRPVVVTRTPARV